MESRDWHGLLEGWGRGGAEKEGGGRAREGHNKGAFLETRPTS